MAQPSTEFFTDVLSSVSFLEVCNIMEQTTNQFSSYVCDSPWTVQRYGTAKQ